MVNKLKELSENILKKVVKNRKSARPFVMFDTDTSQREEQMKNLEIIKSNEKEFIKFLKNSNCALKDVEILTIDGNGRVYLKAKNKKYQILSFTHAEGVKW